jgi:uncharacterized membrane protein YozB (DUF420 family)
MDPKVLYWTAALVNMLAIPVLAARGIRQIRRGEVQRHRRSMKLCVLLVVGFLVSYPFKLLLLGPEDLSLWSGFFRWTLRFHELCVMTMLIAGGVALQRARSMRDTRNVTRAEGDVAAPLGTVRLHRRAGWTGVVGSLLGLLSAALVLAGMFQRM